VGSSLDKSTRPASDVRKDCCSSLRHSIHRHTCLICEIYIKILPIKLDAKISILGDAKGD
jgi:hypothetical protein